MCPKPRQIETRGRVNEPFSGISLPASDSCLGRLILTVDMAQRVIQGGKVYL